MSKNASKVTDMLIDGLVIAVLFGALFPVTTDAINNMGLDNVSVFGTPTDFSWAGYVILLGIVLSVAYIGLSYIKKKGK